MWKEENERESKWSGTGLLNKHYQVIKSKPTIFEFPFPVFTTHTLWLVTVTGLSKSQPRNIFNSVQFITVWKCFVPRYSKKLKSSSEEIQPDITHRMIPRAVAVTLRFNTRQISQIPALCHECNYTTFFTPSIVPLSPHLWFPRSISTDDRTNRLMAVHRNWWHYGPRSDELGVPV